MYNLENCFPFAQAPSHVGSLAAFACVFISSSDFLGGPKTELENTTGCDATEGNSSDTYISILVQLLHTGRRPYLDV